MNKHAYLFDTHALVFWHNRETVSTEFITFFDDQAHKGRLLVSIISFWEIALLVKKGKIALSDVHAWKNEIVAYTNIQLVRPSASEMIDSTQLPDHHKDPFDRLLIAQANHNGFTIVTRDSRFRDYEVETLWM